MNSEGLLKYNDYFYILKDKTLKEEFIKKYYNNPLINYFSVTKLYKLFTRKFF